jgi:hypothetical protein
VKIEWAENFFRALSIVLGAFTVFMIVCIVIAAIQSQRGEDNDEEGNPLGIYFIAAIAASYVIPLITHYHTLKLTDFIKGSIYTLFMTPTFINIIVIYSLSNIHDVTWGSRPTGNQKSSESKRANNMESAYKDFRSWFLVIWLLANIGIGWLVVLLVRSEKDWYLVIIAALMLIVVGAKILFSQLHICMAKIKRCIVGRKTKKRDPFNFRGYKVPPNHYLGQTFECKIFIITQC